MKGERNMAEERKIKGFGAKAGGKKLMHIVCEDGGALCDKRTTGFGKLHTVLTEATCPKCSKYFVYRELLGLFSIGDSLEEIKKVLEETDAAKAAKSGKEKTDKDKEEPGKDKKEQGESEGKEKPETGKPETGTSIRLLGVPAKKKEPVYPPKSPLEKGKTKKEKGKKKPEVPIEKKVDWSLLWDEKKTKCDILHKPSQKVLFESIKSSIALIALSDLNKMKVFWDPSDKIPKDFVPCIKEIMAKAYRKSGEDIPSALTEPSIVDAKKDKKKKPKRQIKRRGEGKKEKRVIKRRSPKGEKETKRVIRRRPKRSKEEVHIITELFGRREGTPGFTIIELLDKGMSLQLMVKKLMEKHGMKKSKAQSKIKAVIRKTARSKGIPIVIKMYKDPNDDIYGLAEDIPI